jgi:hypothetical protein
MTRIFISLFLLLATHTFAQNGVIWYDPITVSDKIYGNLHPRIILDQEHKPLVLWGDINGKAYLSHFNGKTFDEPTQINSGIQPVFTESWAGPEMTSHGDTIYVVYKKMPEETGHIFIKHSYDGGKTFSIETQVDDDRPFITRFPTVAIDPYGNPLVAFMRLDPGFVNARYYLDKSTDLGETFTYDTLIANYSGGTVSDCCPATVIESGNAAVILYRDNHELHRNIWAGISHDGARAFPHGVQVDNTEWSTDRCPANAPDGIIIGDTLYSVFASGDNPLVYLSKTTLSTLSVSSTELTGKFVGLTSQNFPRITNYGNASAMVWTQAISADNQVCLFFTGDIANGFPPHYDTVASGTLGIADVAMGGGHVYIVWEDNFTGKLMCRVGFYEESKENRLLAENTTIALKRGPNGKFFSVALANISSVMMVDGEGRENEMDIKASAASCRVNTEDLDPGMYIVKIYTKDDKVYTYKYEVKEIVEKKHRRDRD